MVKKFLARKKRRDGFTLVEALVAITVLIVGVLGPLSIASRGIADGLFAKNQITANYLAQEALEVIRNIRDNNFVIGGHWLDGGLSECLDRSSSGPDLWPCYINFNNSPTDLSLSAGSAGANCDGDVNNPGDSGVCDTVFDDPDSDPPGQGLFVPSGQASSPSGPVFERAIRIEQELTRPDEIKVMVRMSWRNRATPRSFTLVHYLHRCFSFYVCSP